MKELRIDKFDSLLSVAAAECVREEAAAFLAQDVSEVREDPRLRRKVLGYKPGKGFWRAVKVACLAGLICVSVAFTACMCVPNIRNIIWNTVVTWYEDHVEISFGGSGSQTGEVTASAETVAPATNLDELICLTYLPEGYYQGDELLMSTLYQVNYYSEQEWKFAVTQHIIDSQRTQMDNEFGTLIRVQVNQHNAVLVEYHDEEGVYSLVWQDDQYLYEIYGNFSSLSELMTVAESITLQKKS